MIKFANYLHEMTSLYSYYGTIADNDSVLQHSPPTPLHVLYPSKGSIVGSHWLIDLSYDSGLCKN